jgi:F420-non-reducing hydrogenase iron-sulfur subunit
MCSGRIEPAYILKAFQAGMDGVLVTGCHIGDCHYMKGNEKAEKKIEMAKELLKITGINTDRLRLEWVSASEGARFAEVITEFTETLKELGPTPFNNNGGDAK